MQAGAPNNNHATTREPYIYTHKHFQAIHEGDSSSCCNPENCHTHQMSDTPNAAASSSLAEEHSLLMPLCCGVTARQS
jgi:hypothetical protein